MGLDQYAYVVDGNCREQIAQWRKHNRLQGWMESLAIERDIVSKSDEFNCVDLELSEDDLNKLETDIITFNLPKTDGFFFGADSYDQMKMGYLHDEDMKFLVMAREALSRGHKVVYSCWW